ncbi:hypothetical protein ACOMHN_066997 [Nucella lapillus]
MAGNDYVRWSVLFQKLPDFCIEMINSVVQNFWNVYCGYSSSGQHSAANSKGVSRSSDITEAHNATGTSAMNTTTFVMANFCWSSGSC